MNELVTIKASTLDPKVCLKIVTKASKYLHSSYLVDIWALKYFKFY